MKIQIKLTLILFIVLFRITSMAQVSIRTNAGFSGLATPPTSQYFSFDIGVSIFNGVEIAPTFTFINKTAHKEFGMYWFESPNQDNQFSRTPQDFSTIMGGSAKLFVILHPFRWFNSPALNKIDFGIGSGYGISSYSYNYYNFYEGKNEIESIISFSGNKYTFSVLKMFYNYHFKNFYTGIVISSDELKSFVPLLGIQFGITINNKGIKVSE